MVINLRKAAKRIGDKAAFTISEALVAMIIMLLVTSIVAAGIPTAIRTYDNVVIASNAEVLLSTAMTALRNELGTAKDIEVTNSNTEITYYNQATDTKFKIHKLSEDDVSIVYGQVGGSTTIKLVSDEASDKGRGLQVTYESVDYSNGVVKFTGLKVLKKDGSTSTEVKNADGTIPGVYSIRVIADKKAETVD